MDTDYGPLVEALARHGMPRRTEAVRAAEAVACALGRRMADPAYEDLRELLPPPFRNHLQPCERHAALPPEPMAGLDDFYLSLAGDLGRDPGESEPVARAVFGALRAQVDEAHAEAIAAALPPELLPLWRRPS